MTNKNFSKLDKEMMTLALQLAKKGLYATSPNPMVGCVIVLDGKILGKGYHQKYGAAHAEVNAIKNAKENNNDIKNSIVYITLEPCCHMGKTPPCVDALIKEKISKVIISSLDPNHLVSGKGVKILEKAGIEVLAGLFSSQAKQINRGFFKRVIDNRPFITAKVAMSLDGKTAMASGESKWITSENARKDVQKLRAKNDAIITGVGTILADNPNLTVRDINVKQPLRVILDRNNTLEKYQDLNIFTDGNKTLVLSDDLDVVFKKLAKDGINTSLVEAGATLFSVMIKEKLIDELVIYIAITFLGKNARDVLDLNIDKLINKIQFITKDIRIIGDDIKLTLVPK